MGSPEAKNKHSDLLNLPVYAYKKEEDGKMVLIQVFPTTRAVGSSLGKGHSFYSNIKSRDEG